MSLAEYTKVIKDLQAKAHSGEGHEGGLFWSLNFSDVKKELSGEEGSGNFAWYIFPSPYQDSGSSIYDELAKDPTYCYRYSRSIDLYVEACVGPVRPDAGGIGVVKEGARFSGSQVIFDQMLQSLMGITKNGTRQFLSVINGYDKGLAESEQKRIFRMVYEFSKMPGIKLNHAVYGEYYKTLEELAGDHTLVAAAVPPVVSNPASASAASKPVPAPQPQPVLPPPSASAAAAASPAAARPPVVLPQGWKFSAAEKTRVKLSIPSPSPASASAVAVSAESKFVEVPIEALLVKPDPITTASFAGKDRANKLRVAKDVYPSPAAPEKLKQEIVLTLFAVVIQSVNKINDEIDKANKATKPEGKQLPIGPEEMQKIIDYARENGGFSNKVVEKANAKGAAPIPPDRLQIWQKLSRYIQEGNSRAGIFTGRENMDDGKRIKKSETGEELKVGLRAAFALDILSDAKDMINNLASSGIDKGNMSFANDKVKTAVEAMARIPSISSGRS